MRHLAALAALAATVACGAPPKKRPAAELRRVFVHGEPQNLLQGAVARPLSIFDAAEPTLYDGYEMVGGLVVSQRSEPQSDTRAKSRETLEEDNAAASGPRYVALNPYAFQDHGGTWRYAPAEGKDKLGLTFAAVDGRLALTRAFGRPVRPLHYSQSAAEPAFSLLLEADDAKLGKTLVALYFAKVGEAPARLTTTDERYNYLLGPGVVSAWGGDLAVAICGALPSEDEATFERGIRAWERDGRVGQRSLTVTRLEAAPPFTDLDTHCVQMVDDYLFEDTDWASTTGLALPILDGNRQRILAADVFISRASFTKLQLGREEMQATVAHEFGHFLGLDHEFDKDASGHYLHRSVMGYGTEREVTDHDLDAVEGLYGKYPRR